MTFSADEASISEWMATNAFVSWVTYDRPWEVERQLISEVSLPLNLDMNQSHPYWHVLSQLRRQARQQARELPVVAR